MAQLVDPALATSRGWLRWSCERDYPQLNPEDADPQTWARRRTPQHATVTGWLRVDQSRLVEALSQTVDGTGHVWSQTRVVAGGAPVLRDWTRCTQSTLDAALPPTVAALVAEDAGQLTPPPDAVKDGTVMTWSEHQGVLELRIRQHGPSPWERTVRAVSNGTGKLVFELTGFRLDRVEGPPPDLWVGDAQFTRPCRPLDQRWRAGSSAPLTG